MYQLEHNGYFNVAGLKREFAIKVDDYDEKETLFHTIFKKSQVGETAENGTLMVIDLTTNQEVPNRSKPSKRAIVGQAIFDLGERLIQMMILCTVDIIS